MFQDHPSFIAPENVDIKVWRYMDFPYFLSMLEHNGLFFPRGSLLQEQDPFEGSFPPGNIKMYETMAHKEEFQGHLELRKQASKWYQALPRWMMISCWHMNSDESFAMWKLYAQNNYSISIQSTYSTLKESLNTPNDKKIIHIGKIHYLNYNNVLIREDNAFNQFLCKRKSFEYENELRAIFMTTPTNDSGKVDWHMEPSNSGEWVAMDLNKLIQNIYISPTAQNWFVELVELTLRRFNLTKTVKHSSLREMPVY